MASSIVTVDPPVIKAAGGIVQRNNGRGDEVMIVYRKRHQDWTLPKGKVKDGESFQEAALREVEEETGCSCELGNYLGTISYADSGVPKVVLFWRMSPIEERGVADSEEIGEAVWMQVPAAIQRLSHAQERALLSRVGAAPKQTQPQPQPEPNTAPVPARRRRGSAEDDRAQARLFRESEAFRVELAFLERRSEQADKSWAAAAHDQLDNVKRCLDGGDLEGGWFCLHAAQRYAVYGLNRAELANRAHILRQESLKITSWRAEAIDELLAVDDDQLTAERVADAMALRDEDSTNQYYKTRLTGDQLRVLLVICALASVALLPFMLLAGPVRMLAPVLLFGLFGSSFCAVQSLIRGKNESRIPNLFLVLAPVLFGAVAGLAGYAIYEYVIVTLNVTQPHTSALLAMAFLFGALGQRILARLAAARRKKKPRS